MARLHRADASASRSTAVGPRAPTVGRRLRAAALVAGLGLSLASAGEAAAQDAEDSTAITDAFTALLGGVGKDAEKDATKEGFSWAMSAMGIAGDDAAALATISAELQQIDADLKAIDNTLGQILDAIEDQTCTRRRSPPRSRTPSTRSPSSTTNIGYS
jgi:hypothetical protein